MKENFMMMLYSLAFFASSMVSATVAPLSIKTRALSSSLSAPVKMDCKPLFFINCNSSVSIQTSMLACAAHFIFKEQSFVNNSIDKASSSDSVNISNDALNKVEANKIMNIVNSTPDVRADRVSEVKEKLKDPNYIDDIVNNKLADKIMEAFEI